MNSNPTTDAHGVASHDLLCFATEAHGITSYVWTTTKGKAIVATVRQANDAGYRTMWVQVKCRRYAALDDYDLMDRKIRAHRCYSPDFIQHNDPSSATRPAGRHDCNRSAMAGFAAAHVSRHHLSGIHINSPSSLISCRSITPCSRTRSVAERV